MLFISRLYLIKFQLKLIVIVIFVKYNVYFKKNSYLKKDFVCKKICIDVAIINYWNKIYNVFL